MSTQVWKYKLKQQITLKIPMGAEILSTHVQRNSACIWARVNPEATLETRHFIIVGTGHEISDRYAESKFIGTVLMDHGAFVFHVFEVAELHA